MESFINLSTQQIRYAIKKKILILNRFWKIYFFFLNAIKMFLSIFNPFKWFKLFHGLWKNLLLWNKITRSLNMPTGNRQQIAWVLGLKSFGAWHFSMEWKMALGQFRSNQFIRLKEEKQTIGSSKILSESNRTAADGTSSTAAARVHVPSE